MDNTASLREKFVSACLECVGTKYHHQGRLIGNKVQGNGLDCVGVIIHGIQSIGLHNDGVDVTDYRMMPDGRMLLRKLQQHLRMKKKGDVETGDILLMTFNHQPQHLAVYFLDKQGNEMIVHSSYNLKKCTVEYYTDEYKKLTMAAFEIPGIDLQSNKEE